MRATLVLITVGLLLAACKRTPTDVRGRDAGDLPDMAVETGLQVVVISPSRVLPNTSTGASVIGAGFRPGATVRIGSFAISGVAIEDENTMRVTLPGMPAGTYDVTVTNPDGRASTLRQGLFVGHLGGTCTAVTLYFDLDRSSIKGAERAKLDQQVPCYLEAGAPVKIEGHADERGTTDYNLALGQRRAASVRDFLATTGIAPSRLTTVSYGEERPKASGHNDAAWAQNRRAEVYLLR